MAHGYGALVLTVDAPVSGLRLREWRMGVHLPDDLALPNLAGDSTDSAREGGFMAIVTHEFEPALTPDDIGWLAGLSSLPVVAKGVQRADDAVRCVEAGAAAVVVSNHGARQLADAPATADILAEIVDAVAGRAEVYVDGGVRRSPDVVKALALGARAALVGRPSLWALATGGRRRRGGAAALVRNGAAPDHGPVRRGDGRRHRPRARPAVLRAGHSKEHPGDDGGRHGGGAGGGRPHRSHGCLRALDLARGRRARGRHRARWPGRCSARGPPHVGVLLPNGPEYLFWLNGAALAGATIVGINPTRRGEALASDIRATDCAMIVTDARRGRAARRTLARRARRPGAGHRHRSLPRLLDDFAGRPAARALVDRAGEIDEDALFLLIFTSGTTGVPKAVRCTQGRLAGIAEVAAPGYGYTADDVCYCPMPLFHGNALMALWGPAVMVGAAIAVRPRFSASAFLHDVRHFGATKFSYVGKAIAYILATPERPDDDDNTLEGAFGTEASVRDRDRFRKRFGCYLIEGYGQSEGGAAINPVLGMPKGALGRPVDGVDLAVISPDTGEPCPPAGFDDEGRLLNAGEAIGEIVNRSGRGKFEGYYRRDDAEQDRAGRLVLDRRPRVRGRRRLLLLRGSDRRLAPCRLRELRGRSGRGDPLPPPRPGRRRRLPVPDTASGAGDQVMVALETVPGRAFDPDGFRPGSRRNRTLVPSGCRASCGSRRRSPDGHGKGDQGRPPDRGLGV